MRSTKPLLCLASLCLGTLAAPTTPSRYFLHSHSFYPEVIPGEEMPSLASLGLTNNDLYTKSYFPEALFGTDAHTATPNCEHDIAPCDKASAEALANYLYNLGTQDCRLKGRPTEFAIAGDCLAQGSSMAEGFASSYCRDVAIGAWWIVNNCSPNSKTAGSALAYGNGNLIITLKSKAG
ncbi:hypothetical protein BS50DRAFT_284313 [Corynespora cassiicola Philippines]|uniref:Ecp2 effector protein domain-containing protein n=1 Tax=Corynespora cassiicola Philippines TaxID=1448308 RepID=A0A2T2P1Y4_CORCC|nr:hypothetical protein BS50DRAFT_284313 [Corynespora cassiicola Philippines]